MNYGMELSLERIALVKIAAALWNQVDVKNLLAKFSIPVFSYKDFILEWVKIEAIAVQKVAKLPLPEPIQKKLLCFIRPIGFQISKWRQFHDRGCNLSIDLPNEFHWTPQGTIDKKKTAEVMIKDESIDIATRYKLACINCLEDDISKLWDKIPKGCRKSFCRQIDLIRLVMFWTYHITGEKNKMNRMIEEEMDRKCSPYQYAFEIAAINGNRVATEYFLQKLTYMEREESLVETAKSVASLRDDVSNKDTGFLKETYSDVLCFLLSELDEEQQKEVFKSHPWQVLLCFLDWPLQTFFIETANRMWNFLDQMIFGDLLLQINRNITYGEKDFNYQKLFGDFWQQSPDDYKRYILNVDQGIIYRILGYLIRDNDLNNIKLILQDATLEEKEEIIYDDDMQHICEKLMKRRRWSLIKFIIKECLPSKKDAVEFKEDFENGDVWCVNELQKSNEQWKKFLSMLDEITSEFKKRKCEEDDNSKAKRVCSTESTDVADNAET